TMLEIPDTLRKLREKIGPYLGKTRDFAPQLQLPVVAGWLDRTYGPKKWKVDSLRVRVMVIGKTLVFLVPESTSGKTHLLVLAGDDVEELPRDLERISKPPPEEAGAGEAEENRKSVV